MAFTGLGTGVLGDPYQITTLAEFDQIKTNLSSHFILMANIDTNLGSWATYSFSGVLNGNGFSISNTKQLFSLVGATFKNIKIYHKNISGYNFSSNIDSTTFNNVQIFIEKGDASTQNRFSYNLQRVTATDLAVIASDLDIYFAYGGEFRINNLTNLYVQTNKSIWLNQLTTKSISSGTFTNCKIFATGNGSTVNISKYGGACPWNSCLIVGKIVTNGVIGTTSGYRTVFTDCAFITNISIDKTGVTATYPLYFEGGVNADFIRCHFGGQFNIYHHSYTEGATFKYQLISTSYQGLMTDCHLDYDLNITFDVPPTICEHAITPPDGITAGNITTNFVNCNVTGFIQAGSSVKSGVNCYINNDRILFGLTQTANYTLLTEEQTFAAANFPALNLTTIWKITEGVESPKLINNFYNPDNYLLTPRINSISTTWNNTTSEKLIINTFAEIPTGATLKAYASNTLLNLVSPENEFSVNELNSLLSESIITIDIETPYYYSIVYENSFFQQIVSGSAYHNEIKQVDTQIININAPNYLVFDNLIASYLHGSCRVGEYIYISARGSYLDTPENSYDLVKVNVADYNIHSGTKFYQNRSNTNFPQIQLEQIVYAQGFLWIITQFGYLIRVNHDDLDYMMFYPPVEGDAANLGQPIGCDDNYLFYPGNTAIYKLDLSQLINTFTSYGYTGLNAVYMPPSAIISECEIIQLHPTQRAYCHSIISDDNYIYLAIVTSSAPGTGYSDGIYFYHLQKIEKSTMNTVGDVIIPKTTDDMTQNANYIFLAPEFTADITPDLFGSNFGLVAINKSTMELKFLKALHHDFNTPNETDRAGYGIFYFNTFIALQLIKSKKTVIIRTNQIELWGADYPIGGATEAIYKFQKEGVDILYPPNELILDGNNFAHVTIWNRPAEIMKFPLSEIPALYIQQAEIQTTLNEKTGHSVTISGHILSEGQSPITSGGFLWGTDPQNFTNNLPADPFSYDFQNSITELTPGIYYAKAYGTNTEGTFYGNTIAFTIYNAVSLHNNDTVALLEFIDTHFGCSIRCVQDAPGVPDGTTGTAQDQDGNIYDTVVINELRYMVQNLKTTHFQNGDPVPNITDAAAWQLDEIGAQSAYENKPSNV